MEYLPSITSNFTKTQLKIIADGYLQEISDKGAVLELADLISKMEYFIKMVRENKDYIEEVRSEVQKFGKEYKSPSGTKIELAETGTKYDYTNCGCSELLELEDIQDQVESKIKAMKDFLKALPDEGMMVMNSTTGELEMVFPPIKTSTSSFKTTLPK
jgi:hypothetical protein